jgi:class 3 adenylate cyclase
MSADVAGYSRLMQADEIGTLEELKRRRSAVLSPLVAKYQGRVVKVMGDGVLVEFTSAVNAAQCALDLQAETAKANESLPAHRQIALRIGVNLGDVIVEVGRSSSITLSRACARPACPTDAHAGCGSGTPSRGVSRSISSEIAAAMIPVMPAIRKASS